MIEYTLLLIISVGLVLMVMYKIFQPLQGFVKAYMGDYVACLLETGELPAMGGDNTAAADEGCNSKFEPGTLKEGRPYKGSEATASNEESNKGQNKSASSGGGSGGGGAGGEQGRLFNDKPTRAGDIQASNSKVTELSVAGGGGNGFFNGGSRGGGYQRGPKETSIFLSGLTEEERKKLEKKQEGGTRTIAAEGMGSAPKKTSIKPPEAKTVEMAEAEPMTFGNFLRILFIAAIIIAIVVFIGGQVLQMSKNSD